MVGLTNTTLSYNTITLYWPKVSNGTATGNDPVITFRLQWDNFQYTNPLYAASPDTLTPWVNLTTVAVVKVSGSYPNSYTYVHTVNPAFQANSYSRYRVQAINNVGYGDMQVPFNVLTHNVPDQAATPVIGQVNITAMRINAYWSVQNPDTDGWSNILYYRLEWDQGNSALATTVPWTELTSYSNGIVFSFSQSSGGVVSFANNTYLRYRLATQNAVGLGPYSAPLTILSARTPLQPSTPTLVSVAYNSICINWSLITLYDSTGREPITNYKIQYNSIPNPLDPNPYTDLAIVANNIISYTHSISGPFPTNLNRSAYYVRYRVVAENNVGWGIESFDLNVLTDTYPRQEDQVVIIGAITPVNILISWTILSTSDADTGGENILDYVLQWQEVGTSTWVTLDIDSTSTGQFNVTSGFKLNTYYDIIVTAVNLVGNGNSSTPLRILTDNVPTRMNTPVEDPTTNANFIKVTWASITLDDDTGRDAVIYYKLEWDQGNSTWNELTTPNLLVNSFSLDPINYVIKNGTTYSFRVTPLNLAGFGAVSSTLTIVPSSPPDQMASVTTSICSTCTFVKISWVPPHNNGAPILNYMILIAGTTGTYMTTTDCDGTNPVIMAQSYCNIYNVTLRAAPLNMVKGDNIKVKINAQNLKGYNASYSNPNSVTNTVETEPVAGPYPTRNMPPTTYNSMQLNIPGLSGNKAGGGTATISSYHVQIDQGNNTANTSTTVWTDIKGNYPISVNDTTNPFTYTTGIIGGTTYKVRVRALNKYNWGVWGSVAFIRCASPPNAPPQVTTTNSSTQILISWTEPFNNGLTISAYKIQIMKKSGSSYISTSECDGSQSTVMGSMSCLILMTTFRTTSTFNYVYNDVPTVQVAAINAEGTGPYKNSVGGAAIQTQPLAPTILVSNVVSSTDDTQILLNWNAITGLQNWGGYIVSDYELWWADVSGAFSYELLYTDNYPFTLTLTLSNITSPLQPLIPGSKYKFKYRALNIFGPGLYSPEALIYASCIPDQISAPWTSLSNSTVTLAWDPTPNYHGQLVGAYRVKIQAKNGSFIEDINICNGQKAAIVSSLTCTAAMSLFTTNMNLAIDDLIVLQVEAQNVMGYSIPSPSNTFGITAKKLPQTAPSSLQRGLSTTKTTIQINWTGITASTDTGGQVVDYIVYYDKGTAGASWYVLTTSTANMTTWTDYGFTTGRSYQFKVAAFNDFGIGPQSTAFTIWAAIAPSGQGDPTTTLNTLTYPMEDDIIVINWAQPTDPGGLSVSFKVEILSPNGTFTQVIYTSECAENGWITNYFVPTVTTTNTGLQCTMLVATLYTKYGIPVGGIVQARITSYQVVGSTMSTVTGSGTAVILTPPCYRTTFPRILGGTNNPTSITAMDVDSLGNIVVGGYSQDSGYLGIAPTQSLPQAVYIAKGDLYLWGKYIQTTDGITANQFSTILDIAFRYDGQKVVMSLDNPGYAQAYTLVILNGDGSLYASFKEGNNQRGKVNITGLLFDNSNIITAALDLSVDGSATNKQAAIIRFSAANPTATSVAPSFYIAGGAAGKISQSFLLKRIYSDTTSIYAAAYLQDANSNRRALLAKISLSNGAVSKYFQYQASPVAADYNTDASFANIRRWSLYEDDITTNQVISACIVSNDGTRPYFGQFIFSTSQLFTVLAAPTATLWYCLGMYQRYSNTAYVLFNDRSAVTPSGYNLYYGKIDYLNKVITAVPIVEHYPPTTYYGGLFVHSARFYYFGDALNIVTANTYVYPQRVGFINLYDQQETGFSCSNSNQIYNFASGYITVPLTSVVVANMAWMTTGYSSGPTFAAQTGKTFKPFTLTGGVFSVNFNEPMSNNTYCPIVNDPVAPTVSSPIIGYSLLTFNPDATVYPPQYVTYGLFTANQVCPDQVYYYSSFLSDTSSALPSFVQFQPYSNQYVFNINSATNVGTYHITLQSTIGNNKTTQVQFTVQVASPCLGLTVIVPPITSIPQYDISNLANLLIPLNWDVQNSPTPSCGNINFIFKLLNATAGGVVDTSVFSIINTTSGVQQLKVWTQSIPATKFWTDIKIQAYLQGDLVQTQIFTVNITNRCAAAKITPNTIADQTYYSGRDPLWFIFAWSETVGTCGPISYSSNAYLTGLPSSNTSLDSGVFQYPQTGGGNNTLSIYSWDLTKVGTYQVRVWGSLGVGGYQQNSITFNVFYIQDPCSFFPYVTTFVPDLTLWINQTNQIVNIPQYKMNDTSWICNFTYVFTDGVGNTLDPIFVVANVALQGFGTNVTIVTSNIAKVNLSPQTIKVIGWPNRQNTTSQTISFRVFVAYNDPTDCSSGSYYDNVTMKCLPCLSPCSTCKSPGATVCTWCVTGYTYNELSNNCTFATNPITCPNGTKSDPVLGICRACPSFCSICSDLLTCTTCLNGYNLANGTCFLNTQSQPGFRYDTGIGFQPCPANCANCPTTSTCSVCVDKYFLDTTLKVCTQTCPEGYYADAGSKVCMQCSAACKTCVTNNYTCTSCQPVNGIKFYLFQSTCVTRCPYKGYFQNFTAETCDPCSPACMVCVGSSTDCIVCSPGSVISGRSCLNSCPVGQYITPIGTCFLCDSSCSACYGAQNSMCTQCVNTTTINANNQMVKTQYYLTSSSCDLTCADPLFPEDSSGTCASCAYYCNSCTLTTNCMKCKAGYAQLPQNCQGENFLHVTSNQSLTVPINTAVFPTGTDPTMAAIEFWFKADDIMALSYQIIVGLSPYKIMKKAGIPQIQILYSTQTWCDSINLQSATWYHYSFSITEASGGQLQCYLNGEALSTGINPVGGLAANIPGFTEISFGTSVTMKSSEAPFVGYIKEFRWWKKPRNQFQFLNFMNVALTNINVFSPPNGLVAYWKLGEDRATKTVFNDYASGGSLTYDPSIGNPNLKLSSLMEMREIYLKFCPEATYTFWNDTLGFYDCAQCDSACGNCNGPTPKNCTACIAPYKLLETEQTCIIAASCPPGYWIDANGNCWPCHPFCSVCYGPSQYECTACSKGYFKAYKRQGCVNSCPIGLYGNFLTQSCAANPTVDTIFPADNSIFTYGTFLDLSATFTVKNGEPDGTYWYNWIITKLGDSKDLSGDAAKPYANTDITRVHLDNNIISPNNYYNITFYVKGNGNLYNGMMGYMFNVIYIGIPPKNGYCRVTPFQGVAEITEFTFSTEGWVDPDGISEYRFLYSLDQGVTYLPLDQSSITSSEVKFTFAPIFQSATVKLQCNVKSLKGFYSSAYTSFPLAKRSSSSSQKTLTQFTLASVTTEPSSLQAAYQLQSIASDLGSLSPVQPDLFAPKVTADTCTQKLCSFNGDCVYLQFSNQYYCNCFGTWTGRNCSFQNNTQLEIVQNLTLATAQKYNTFGGGDFDLQFLTVASSNLDVMTDDLFDVMHPLVDHQIRSFTKVPQSDTTMATNYLKIISNMLEYLQVNQIVNNVTQSWNSTGANSTNSSTSGNRRRLQTSYQNQVQKNLDNLNKTMKLVSMIQNSTRYQLSFLTPQIQIQTRMIAYTQILTSRDQYLSMPATTNVPTQFATFVRMSPSNFMNVSLGLNYQFIAEAIQYFMNPFALGNDNNIASGIIQYNLYNQNLTYTSNNITKVDIQNLTTSISFYFPASDNGNLTAFFKEYNTLSPFRYSEITQRQTLLTRSGLKCIYWDTNNQSWSENGCKLTSLDKTHVGCQCNHLSTFSISFTTPVVKITAPLLQNSTVKARSSYDRVLELSDIIKWPLSAYIENLGVLWMHNLPSFISFLLKPGFVVIILFWSMYVSSLIYYSGRDDLKRYKMTKSQNRDDLAEINNDVSQNLFQVIRDLIVRDFLTENGRYIQKEARRKQAPQLSRKQIQPPQIKIYEDMSRHDKKRYKKRARRKVFGIPGDLCQRARRYYNRTMKHNNTNPNAKMSFFNDELKNNLWIGLIAKTSKIAPRHVRLCLMYFYASLYIWILTIVFAFDIQDQISSNALFQVVTLCFIVQPIVWVITIPVAMIFRMPMHLRVLVAGVRTKKINKVFKEVDAHMGWRYAIGYFICLTMYVVMTLTVLIFNIFYPQDYVIGWAFNIVLLYMFDLVIFTFGLAAIQMGNVIISQKVKWWYNVWAAIEVFRYAKNLRG